MASSPTEWLQESSLGFASQGDDDFSLSVSLCQISDGFGDLPQRVRSVDDRCELPGLEEPLQDGHLVLLARHREVREVRGRQLAHERRERHQFEEARDASEPAAGPLPEAIVSYEYVFPIGGEDASTIRKRMVAGDVEDQVVEIGRASCRERV